MKWSKLDEEKRLCKEWLQDPLINPETGKTIQRNGPTFLAYKQKCKEFGLKQDQTLSLTKSKFQEWKKNPIINPHTGRKIKKNGPTYKLIEKQCKNMKVEKGRPLVGNYYLPDNDGMIPCVKIATNIYAVRRYDHRKIWGPLNKPAKGIRLCYFKDTWDYKYKHLCPIFINKSVPKKKDKRNVMTNTERRESKYIVDDIIDLFIAKK